MDVTTGKIMATSKSKTTKKETTKKAAVKKPASKKTEKKAKSKKEKLTKKKIKVTSEQRHKMICEAAYYVSLEKGYGNVNPTDDWFQAETAINKIYTTHAN